MSNEKLTKQSDFLTNCLYMTALAMDLMIRESERLLKLQTPPHWWKHEKKQMFTRYLDSVKKACLYNEQITQDVYDVEEKNQYKYVQVWQEEANELARFILLMADKTSDVDVVAQIHKFIRQFPGDGLATDELLNRFYLKKYDRKTDE